MLCQWLGPWPRSGWTKVERKLPLFSGEIHDIPRELPPGKHTKSYWKWPIEFFDLPISMVIFHSCVTNYQRVNLDFMRISWFFQDFMGFPMKSMCGIRGFSAFLERRCKPIEQGPTFVRREAWGDLGERELDGIPCSFYIPSIKLT